jgi:hypothetical protein
VAVFGLTPQSLTVPSPTRTHSRRQPGGPRPGCGPGLCRGGG